MPQENNLKPHPNRQLVLWLALPQLITWGSVYYTFALLLGPIEQALQLSRAQASLGFSLMLLADGLLALPLAKYLRNGHERVIMTAGTLLTALLLVLHSKIQTQWQFYAVWTGLGLAGSMCLYTPLFTVLTQRFPHHFRQSIITITLVAGLASTVFIPLSNACIDAWGWRNALLFLASLQLLICLPIHYFILQEKNFEQPLEGQQQKPVPAAKETRANWVILKKYLKNPAYYFCGFFIICSMAVTSALPPHLIAILQERKLSPYWVIAIPAAIGFMQVVGRLVLFMTERYWNVNKSNLWIATLLPISFLLFDWPSTNIVILTLFVVLFGFANGLLTIVKGTVIPLYVNQKDVAVLTGALGFPQAIAKASAPLLLGLSWSPKVGYLYGLIGLTFFAGVSVIALLAAQKMAQPSH